MAIVYRRVFAEMPAWPKERDEAMRAGVHFLILTQPLGYVADEQGKLTGLKVVRTPPGPRRTRRPPPAASHSRLRARAARRSRDRGHRPAGGSGTGGALRGLEFTRSGASARAEGSLATTRAGVFAAGDIVNGGTTVVQAVAEGARAACEIHRYLEESGNDMHQKTVAG